MATSRADLLLYAAGLAGIAAFATLCQRAFPQAAVKVEITREAVLARTRAVTESLGVPPRLGRLKE